MQEEHAKQVQTKEQTQVKTKEVKENIQLIQQEKPKKQKVKKTDKVKVEEVLPNTPNISTPVDVIKNEQKMVPIIRTRPVLREIDYTINDI